MRNGIPFMGEWITVHDGNGKKRRGQVVYIHPRKRWYVLEFLGNYTNCLSGIREKYREAFRVKRAPGVPVDVQHGNVGGHMGHYNHS